MDNHTIPLPEVFIPRLPVFEPYKTPTSVGHIAVNDEEFIEFQGDNASLGIVLLFSNAIRHFQWRSLRQDSDSGIAIFVTGEEVALVSIDFRDFRWEFVFTAFRLLDAEHIGIFFFDVFESSFRQPTPDSVDIEGSNLPGACEQRSNVRTAIESDDSARGAISRVRALSERPRDTVNIEVAQFTDR